MGQFSRTLAESDNVIIHGYSHPWFFIVSFLVFLLGSICLDMILNFSGNFFAYELSLKFCRAESTVRKFFGIFFFLITGFVFFMIKARVWVIALFWIILPFLIIFSMFFDYIKYKNEDKKC